MKGEYYSLESLLRSLGEGGVKLSIAERGDLQAQAIPEIVTPEDKSAFNPSEHISNTALDSADGYVDLVQQSMNTGVMEEVSMRSGKEGQRERGALEFVDQEVGQNLIILILTSAYSEYGFYEFYSVSYSLRDHQSCSDYTNNGSCNEFTAAGTITLYK